MEFVSTDATDIFPKGLYGFVGMDNFKLDCLVVLEQ
jgi:hypothetical protein